jgi:hypothetical protein
VLGENSQTKICKNLNEAEMGDRVMGRKETEFLLPLKKGEHFSALKWNGIGLPVKDASKVLECGLLCFIVSK